MTDTAVPRQQGDVVTEIDREPNTEAADYIEDDPEAWSAWLSTVREYGPQFAALTAHLGSEDAAAEVTAGTMLSVLADRYGVFLIRGIEVVTDTAVPRTAKWPRTGMGGILLDAILDDLDEQGGDPKDIAAAGERFRFRICAIETEARSVIFDEVAEAVNGLLGIIGDEAEAEVLAAIEALRKSE